MILPATVNQSDVDELNAQLRELRRERDELARQIADKDREGARLEGAIIFASLVLDRAKGSASNVPVIDNGSAPDSVAKVDVG